MGTFAPELDASSVSPPALRSGVVLRDRNPVDGVVLREYIGASYTCRHISSCASDEYTFDDNETLSAPPPAAGVPLRDADAVNSFPGDSGRDILGALIFSARSGTPCDDVLLTGW